MPNNAYPQSSCTSRSRTRYPLLHGALLIVLTSNTAAWASCAVPSGESEYRSSSASSGPIPYQNLPLSELIAQTFVLSNLESILVAAGMGSSLNPPGHFTGFLPWDPAFEEAPYLEPMKGAPRLWSDHFAAFMMRHISDASVAPVLDADNRLAPPSRITMMDGSQLFLEIRDDQRPGSLFYGENERNLSYPYAQVALPNGAAFLIEETLTSGFVDRSLYGAVHLLDEATYGHFISLIDCLINDPGSAEDEELIEALRSTHAVEIQGMTILAPQDSALNSLAELPSGPDCPSSPEERLALSDFVRRHVLASNAPTLYFGSDIAVDTVGGDAVRLSPTAESPEACDDCGVFSLADDPEVIATTVEGHQILAESGMVYGIDSALLRDSTPPLVGRTPLSLPDSPSQNPITHRDNAEYDDVWSPAPALTVVYHHGGGQATCIGIRRVSDDAQRVLSYLLVPAGTAADSTFTIPFSDALLTDQRGPWDKYHWMTEGHWYYEALVYDSTCTVVLDADAEGNPQQALSFTVQGDGSNEGYYGYDEGFFLIKDLRNVANDGQGRPYLHLVSPPGPFLQYVIRECIDDYGTPGEETVTPAFHVRTTEPIRHTRFDGFTWDRYSLNVPTGRHYIVSSYEDRPGGRHYFQHAYFYTFELEGSAGPAIRRWRPTPR